MSGPYQRVIVAELFNRLPSSIPIDLFTLIASYATTFADIGEGHVERKSYPLAIHSFRESIRFYEDNPREPGSLIHQLETTGGIMMAKYYLALWHMFGFNTGIQHDVKQAIFLLEEIHWIWIGRTVIEDGNVKDPYINRYGFLAAALRFQEGRDDWIGIYRTYMATHLRGITPDPYSQYYLKIGGRYIDRIKPIRELAESGDIRAISIMSHVHGTNDRPRPSLPFPRDDDVSDDDIHDWRLLSARAGNIKDQVRLYKWNPPPDEPIDLKLMFEMMVRAALQRHKETCEDILIQLTLTGGTGGLLVLHPLLKSTLESFGAPTDPEYWSRVSTRGL